MTGSEAEAIELLGERRLDIVLVDGEADRLPAVVHRVEALAAASSARIVCFVSSGDARRIGALLMAGAESCVATSVAPDDLAAVVREASRGTIFHAPPTPAGQQVSETPASMVSGLTNRELEVLTLAAEGLAEQADRAAAVGDAEDDQVPPVERVPQARRVEPDGGDAPGAAARAAAGRRRRRLRRSGPAGRAGPAAPRRPFLLAAPAGAVRGEIPRRGASHPPRTARMAAGVRGGGVVAVRVVHRVPPAPALVGRTPAGAVGPRELADAEHAHVDLLRLLRHLEGAESDAAVRADGERLRGEQLRCLAAHLRRGSPRGSSCC